MYHFQNTYDLNAKHRCFEIKSYMFKKGMIAASQRRNYSYRNVTLFLSLELPECIRFSLAT